MGLGLVELVYLFIVLDFGLLIGGLLLPLLVMVGVDVAVLVWVFEAAGC